MKTDKQLLRFTVVTIVAALLQVPFIVNPARAQTWSPGSYPNLQTNSTSGASITVGYQGAPPSSNSAGWPGYPASQASTQQINYMLASAPAIAGLTASTWTGGTTTSGGISGGTTRMVWLWANRMNSLGKPNSNPNPIAPTAPGISGSNATLTLTAPLAWAASVSPAYQVGELVTYPTMADTWYKCLNSVSGTTPPPSDTADWAAVTPGGSIVAPACRFEYGSWKNAIASNIVQALWLTGSPAVQWTGASGPSPMGFMDVAIRYNLAVYCFGPSTGSDPTQISGVVNLAATASTPNTIFTKRPLHVASLANIGDAVYYSTAQSGSQDGLYLPINRLSDCWTDYLMAPYVSSGSPGGANWSYGEIVRDQQNLLPNDFLHYDASSYTSVQGGLLPAAALNTFSTGTANGYPVGYVQLDSTHPVIRNRYPIAATASSTNLYQLTVTGMLTSAASNSRIFLQVVGLDSAGHVIGSIVEGTFPPAGNPFSSSDTGKQFTFVQTFSASGGSGSLAFPVPTGSQNPLAYLRFSAYAENATAQISSLLVQDVSGGQPATTYWQCINGSGYSSSAPASGEAFTPFSTIRASSPTGTWQPQKLGIELDYEVSDQRPADFNYAYDGSTAYSNTDENAVYLFTSLANACHAQGYQLTVYTNDIDALNGVAKNNSLVEENLDEVLANTDYFVPTIDGANYRWNSATALAGAAYYRLRYQCDPITGAPTSTPRSHYAANKIGFSLAMPDKHFNACIPVTAVTSKNVGGTYYYQITTATTGSSAVVNGYIELGGFAGSYASLFNGNVFHVKTGGQSFVIDQIVSGSSADANGVVSYSVAPFTASASPPPYTGGGVAGGGGTTANDYQYFASQFIQNASTSWQVMNWEQWRDSATQTAYVSTSSPTIPTAGIQSITLFSSGVTAVTLSSGDVTTFPSRTDSSGNKIYTLFIDGISSGTQINGLAFQAVTTGTDPLGVAYSGTYFALKNFDGLGVFSVGTTSTSGTATDASSQDINRKTGTLSFGAGP